MWDGLFLGKRDRGFLMGSFARLLLSGTLTSSFARSAGHPAPGHGASGLSGLCLLLLPPRIALGRCVPSLLCADCSRRHTGEAAGAAGAPAGAGGTWGLPVPAFSGSPRRQLPAGLQGTYFLFGRSSLVPLPGGGAEGIKGQGPGWTCASPGQDRVGRSQTTL